MEDPADPIKSNKIVMDGLTAASDGNPSKNFDCRMIVVGYAHSRVAVAIRPFTRIVLSPRVLFWFRRAVRA